MTPPVFRFAPSPNGYLHLGHALSALLNAKYARAAGGSLLLRIEDIDLARCRPEYETAILEDLAWLGLSWEQQVRRQSEHFADYAAALKRLEEMDLVYPAFESRAEIARLVEAREADGKVWPRDPDGTPLYPGSGKDMSATEREARIASGEPFTMRLDMTAALARSGPVWWTEVGDFGTNTIGGNPSVWGDVILSRRDAPASYHLAVVVDDALQGVTNIVRGIDLFPATGVHRVLQTLLGLPEPLYRHHRLVMNSEGRKLSKSDNATGLRELRAQGRSPADIRSLIGL